MTHISEVLGFDAQAQRYALCDLFARRYDGLDGRGNVVSELLACGVVPAFAPRLKEHGIELPAACWGEPPARPGSGAGAVSC